MGDREERDLLCQPLLELSFGRTAFNTDLLLLILKINTNAVHLDSINNIEPNIERVFFVCFCM